MKSRFSTDKSKEIFLRLTPPPSKVNVFSYSFLYFLDCHSLLSDFMGWGKVEGHITGEEFFNRTAVEKNCLKKIFALLCVCVRLRMIMFACICGFSSNFFFLRISQQYFFLRRSCWNDDDDDERVRRLNGMYWWVFLSFFFRRRRRFYLAKIEQERDMESEREICINIFTLGFQERNNFRMIRLV